MESFTQEIQEIEASLKAIDHMLFVSFSLIQDKGILVGILKEMDLTLRKLISLILKYEYIKNNLLLSKDSKENLGLFFSKCAQKYGLSSSDKLGLVRILKLGNFYKNSEVDFFKEGSIIMIRSGVILKISLPEIKSFFYLTKSFFEGFFERLGPEIKISRKV